MSSRSRFIRLTRKSFWSLALLAPLCAAHSAYAQTTVKTQGNLAVKTSAAHAAPAGSPVIAAPQQVALRDSVPVAVANAANLGPIDGGQNLSVLICFAFADPQAAEACANAVSNPASPLYRQWLTPEEVGQKFGATPDDYAAMLNFVQASGLKVDESPVNRLSLRVSGTAAQIQQAFGTTINNYRESAADAIRMRGADAVPYAFYAPATPALLPAALAGKITSLEGMETYNRPIIRSKKAKAQSALFDAVQARVGYNLSPMYDALNATASNKPGTGRTIGISNFDGFNPSLNAPLYINRNTLPYPRRWKRQQYHCDDHRLKQRHKRAGGRRSGFSGGFGQAPLANIIIYDGGSGRNSNLIGVLTREASDNKADVLTESYGWSYTGSSADSAHTQHTIMTMQGQTYLTASGDNGNVANNAYQYSDFDPDVLVIGGTILTVNGSNAFSSEAGWTGSGGGACTATNSFNVLPAWQKGRAVPTTNKRLSPDISSHAQGSGGGAYYIYYGGSLTGISGTSCASPTDAGDFAVMEQYLISLGALSANAAGKQRLGRINDQIYAYNGRSDVFNDTTGGVSNGAGTTAKYWDYVTGWGSVNWYKLRNGAGKNVPDPDSPRAGRERDACHCHAVSESDAATDRDGDGQQRADGKLDDCQRAGNYFRRRPLYPARHARSARHGGCEGHQRD